MPASKYIITVIVILSNAGVTFAQDMTKEDYINLSARSWKNFQCAYLHETATGLSIYGDPFKKRGYELGKEFFAAIDAGKLMPYQFTLQVPYEFTSTQRELSTDFDLGQIYSTAKNQIAGEVIVFNKDLPASFENFSQNDLKIDNEGTAKKAINKIKTENCDYDDLGLSQEIIANIKSAASRGPVNINKLLKR
ncbi:hypothetical protein [Brucella pseudogrignonensis]|uniref:Uncharacterized protein n=1 Tax=Brucella pseudogrignonensis TaxID=419475 RepID=A0ABU1M8G7_9HYPH|nr:hypothetical protein [Brucella pseudogrignonensis]MDR6432147.1 hypothetical protein [Brucella pseudogrignonensis]